MTTFLFVSLIIVLVPAIAALVHAVHRAADGYEDEFQFHVGACPRSSALPASAGERLAPNWIEGPRTQLLPQLAVKETVEA